MHLVIRFSYIESPKSSKKNLINRVTRRDNKNLEIFKNQLQNCIVKITFQLQDYILLSVPKMF